MTGSLVLPCVLSALLALALGGALGAGWMYWKWMRPARFLSGVLHSLAAEEPAAPPPSRPPAPLPALTPLGRAAGPLAECAGPVAALVARLRDTDRQLHDENFNLQAILGGLSEGVLIVDRSHKIRLVNDGLRRMFDLRASPLNRSLLEVFRHHQVQQAILEALDGGAPAQTRPLTLSTRQEDGRYAEKHFDLTAGGLLPRGAERPVGAIAVFHDVTQLRSLESVRREFVANVSHELRTPLSIINGYLETLLEDHGAVLDDRPTTERFLGVMQKHGERLNLLVEDLLTISQLESGATVSAGGGSGNDHGNNLHPGGGGSNGHAGLHLEPVDLRLCVGRVIERLSPIAQERGIRVRLGAPADPLMAEADPHRLDQAVFNLLDNALKYGVSSTDPRMSPPEVCVRVERLRATAPIPAGEEDGDANAADGGASITVSDNGPGIPLADQPHVFERFYRVHKDRSREAGGTGLGLSIVKHIAQAHGGSVTLESRPGQGAAFTLRLPAAAPRAGA